MSSMATTLSTPAAPSYTSSCSSSSSCCKQKLPCLQDSPAPADPTFASASQVPSHLHDPHHDSRRPIYHPQSARGWSSDPCGPIFYKGRYHLFYQHLRSSCQWYWGICWDHLVSDDLVTWKNLPPAVVPTPGWYDADGCFSGTVEFDPELGVPVIMYTGVYLKANKEAVAAHGLPPPGHDPGTRFVERQLAAVPADPDDPDLTVWTKLPEPVMQLAPKGVSCWRDPFCVQRPAAAGGSGDEWVVGLASGVKGVGGAVLRFKSKHFTHGWQFDGFLAAGDNKVLGLRGNDWECPILSHLPHIDAPPALASLPALGSSSNSSSRLGGGSVREQYATAASNLEPSVSQQQQMLDLDASAAAAAMLEPSASQQQLRELDVSAAAAAMLQPNASPQQRVLSKHKRGVGSCMSSLASAESLLAVGQYPACGAASSSYYESETISSSVSECCRASEVSSNAGSGFAHQGSAVPAASLGISDVTFERLAEAAAAAATSGGATSCGSSSSTSVVGGAVGMPGTCGDGAVAPLTEPVLAAATAATEAAAGTGSMLAQPHPSTNLYAWLEQTPEPAQAAAAAAAAAVAAAKGSSLAEDDVRDVVVVIDDASSSSSLKLQEIAAVPAAALLDSTPADVSPEAAAATTPGTTITPSTSCGKDWFFCISPEACNFPITWWLGSYDGRSLDVAAADGPHKLDLGTTLYAATMWQDPQGRQLLYGWMQEHRRVPTPPALCEDFCYAGCIGTPRVLQLLGDRLFQSPLPEIDALRTKVSWHAQDLAFSPEEPMLPLQVVSGTHLDINITFQPPAAVPTGPGSRVGLVFKSWKPCGRGAAVLSFDWSTAALTVDFDEPLPDAYTPNPEDTPERKRIGGVLRNYEPGSALSLRVLLDGSALEVFTSTGETLTTRVYRGHPPSSTRNTSNTSSSSSSSSFAAVATVNPNAPPAEDETGISIFAAGAAVVASRVDVWEMGCCMVELEDASWLDREIYVHPQHQADDSDQDRMLRQASRSTSSVVNAAVVLAAAAVAAVPTAGLLVE